MPKLESKLMTQVRKREVDSVITLLQGCTSRDAVDAVNDNHETAFMVAARGHRVNAANGGFAFKAILKAIWRRYEEVCCPNDLQDVLEYRDRLCNQTVLGHAAKGGCPANLKLVLTFYEQVFGKDLSIVGHLVVQNEVDTENKDIINQNIFNADYFKRAASGPRKSPRHSRVVNVPRENEDLVEDADDILDEGPPPKRSRASEEEAIKEEEDTAQDPPTSPSVRGELEETTDVNIEEDKEDGQMLKVKIEDQGENSDAESDKANYPIDHSKNRTAVLEQGPVPVSTMSPSSMRTTVSVQERPLVIPEANTTASAARGGVIENDANVVDVADAADGEGSDREVQGDANSAEWKDRVQRQVKALDQSLRDSGVDGNSQLMGLVRGLLILAASDDAVQHPIRSNITTIRSLIPAGYLLDFHLSVVDTIDVAVSLAM